MSLKSWFRKIKMKFIWKFAENWAAEFLDRLKVKRPRIYAGVAMVLSVLHFGAQAFLRVPLEQAMGTEMATEFLSSLPDKFLSLEYILLQVNVTDGVAEALGMGLTWIGGIVLTTRITPFLMSESRKEKRIAKSKEISKQQQAKKAAA